MVADGPANGSTAKLEMRAIRETRFESNTNTKEKGSLICVTFDAKKN